MNSRDERGSHVWPRAISRKQRAYCLRGVGEPVQSSHSRRSVWNTVNHLPWRNGDRMRAQQHQDYSESTDSIFEWAKGINQDRRAGANCSRLFSVGNQRPRCERSGQCSISVHQRGGNVDITPHIICSLKRMRGEGQRNRLCGDSAYCSA